MELECKRCLYKWNSKVKKPKQCPNCKQYFYDKEREWIKKQSPNNKTEEQEALKEIEQEPTEEEIEKSLEEVKQKGEFDIL